MTALLESPVGTLDVSRLEERQPDVPLTCTKSTYPTYTDTCHERAAWEALCMTCGHIFRRCENHHADDIDVASWNDGICDECAECYESGLRDTFVYIAQYARIGA